MLNNRIPIDLHCHSTYSDGTLGVKELLDLAKANGGKYIALTDHDTVDGIAEARTYAKEIGLHFFAGVEISVTWEKNEILHILGLNIDENNTNLRYNLNQIRCKRLSRAKKIAENLAKIGIEDALAGAMKYCIKEDVISRTHFSRFLVDNGYAKPGKAFEKYLAPGRVGYISQKWAELHDALKWIADSGGVAVIAHPGRYKFTRTKLLKLIAQFKEFGGNGIEVVSSCHSLADINNIAKIAQDNNLLCSIGSDFHSLSEGFRQIIVGTNMMLPSICTSIYSTFGITEFN